MYLLVSLVFSAVAVARKCLICLLYNLETCCNVSRVWSRTVSRLLLVSALAWPLVVINRKVCSAEFKVIC